MWVGKGKEVEELKEVGEESKQYSIQRKPIFNKRKKQNKKQQKKTQNYTETTSPIQMACLCRGASSRRGHLSGRDATQKGVPMLKGPPSQKRLLCGRGHSGMWNPRLWVIVKMLTGIVPSPLVLALQPSLSKFLNISIK